MVKIKSLEEGLLIFDNVFSKALCMLKGAPPRELFSEQDYAKFYHCVRDLCHSDSPPEWQMELYNRCTMALKESIKIVVVPSIEEQKGDCLLLEVLHMWAKFRAMTKFLSRFLHHRINEPGFVPLVEARFQFFCSPVCSRFFDKCCDVVISLINEERRETFTVGRTTLKIFVAFSLEMRREDTITYYDLFEQALLDDAAKYYSDIALELLKCDSYQVYNEEALKLLSSENLRGKGFLTSASLEKLMEVVRKHLVDETARKFIEREKSKGRDRKVLEATLAETEKEKSKARVTKLLEMERDVCSMNHPDPCDLQKAKEVLKDHEQALVDALTRLAEASDGESDGEQQLSSNGQPMEHE